MNARSFIGLSRFTITACLLVAGGCTGKSELELYSLSGTVTFRYKPVPGGRIVFEPIVARGNSGPGSIAEIKDGKFSTRPGKGTVGGPHQVTIFGDDGGMPTELRDNALFAPYRTEVDLPFEDAQHDFNVPNQ